MNDADTETFLRRTFRGSRDALMQRALDEPDLTWRVLITLNTFRTLIAIALLVLFTVSANPRFFGDQYPTLFAATAAAYLVFSVLAAVSLRQRWVPIPALGVTQLLVDIVAITTLMHASGGIGSGLGGLLIVFIGASSLVLPIQYPAILAAAATFAILGEQTLAQFGGATDVSVNYPAAGVLSGVIFLMALAAQDDVALLVSKSGETSELGGLTDYLLRLGVHLLRSACRLLRIRGRLLRDLVHL